MHRLLRANLWLTACLALAPAAARADILIDDAWLAAKGAPPYILDQAGATYVLQTDVAVPETAFVAGAADVTLDLNGHTVTYGDAEPLTVDNGGFEQAGNDSFDILGWDTSKAPGAERVPARKGMWGGWMLRLYNVTDVAQRIISEPITLPKAGREYAATITPKGPSGAIVSVLVKDAVTKATIAGASMNGISRGFSPVVQFSTDTPNPIQLVVVVKGEAGKSVTVDLDYAAVMASRDYGVLASPSVWYFPPHLQDPKITNAASKTDGIAVRNGLLVQGRGRGYASSPFYLVSTPGGVTIEGVEAFANGMDTIHVEAGHSGNVTVRGSTFRADIDRISHRMRVFAALKLNGANLLIEGNRILDAPQQGINLGGNSKDVTIADNEIRQRAIVTNGYAISVGGKRFKVHGNTIIPVKGRGLMLDTASSGSMSDGEIYGNHVEVYEQPNLEYGRKALEATALRMRVYGSDSIRNVRVHDNVFIARTDAEGVWAALAGRVSVGNGKGLSTGADNRIENNVFKGIVGSGNAGDWTRGLDIGGVGAGTGLEISGNVIESNHVSLGFGSNDSYQQLAEDILLVSNTFRQSAEGDARTYRSIHAGWYRHSTKNIRLFDAKADGGLSLHLEGPGTQELLFGWLLGVTALDEASSPIPGAEIRVLDVDGVEVASGTADANGQVLGLRVVSEIRRHDGSTASTEARGPHKVLAAATGFKTACRSVDLASSMIINLTLAPEDGTPSSCSPSNQAPAADAGADQAVTLPAAASLDGTVSDDGLPDPPAALTTAWTKVSGPGDVTFGDAAAVDTTAAFSASGTYVLRLTADDGELQSSDDVVIAVEASGASPVLVFERAPVTAFDGVDDKLVADADPDWSGDFTVAFWAQADDAKQAVNTGLFSSFYTGGLDFQAGESLATFQIVFDGNGNYAFFSAGPGGGGDAPYLIAPATTSWQHLAATLSGNTLKVYSDGAATHAYTLQNGEGREFRDYLLGANRKGLNLFQGKLAEAKVYDGALADAEIAALAATPPVDPAPAPMSGIFVSPAGQPGASGSKEDPINLATAIGAGTPAKPGDTIWLLGGTYQGKFTSLLKGAPDARITLRAAPGERAVIDGGIAVDKSGGYTDYRDLEIWDSAFKSVIEETASDPAVGQAPGGGGLNISAAGTRFINNIIHDCFLNVGFWRQAENAELYGNVIFNGGYFSSAEDGRGHNVYTQNDLGRKRIIDNILFASGRNSFNVYQTNGGPNRGFLFEGNVVINDRWLIGGVAATDDITLVENFTYGSGPSFGYTNKNDGSATAVRNHIMLNNASFPFSYWAKVVAVGNLVYHRGGQGRNVALTVAEGWKPGDYAFEQNLYFRSSSPAFRIQTSQKISDLGFTGWQALGYDGNGQAFAKAPDNAVIVRPNRFEKGRAHVVVYNWAGLPSITVSLSGVGLEAGDEYEILNARNVLGDAPIRGTYDGAPIELPMNGWTKVRVNNFKTWTSDPSTPAAPEFGIFIVRKAGGGLDVANHPPVPNAGSDQIVALPDPVALDGEVLDDAPAEMTTAWSKAAGPGSVTFVDASKLDTAATFSATGTYALRLTVHDGALEASDYVTITVEAPAPALVFERAPITAFDGVDDKLVADADPDWSGDFTVALWARADDANQTVNTGLFSSFYTGGLDFQAGESLATFQISFDGDGSYAFFSAGPGGGGNAPYLIAPAKTSWQHLAATLSGNTLKVYSDGAATHAYTLQSGEGREFRDYLLGANRKGLKFFQGKLAEAKVYDGALADADIAALAAVPPADSPANCRTGVRLALHPLEADQAYLAVKSDCPEFTGQTLSLTLGLPSGAKSAVLDRHDARPDVYYAKLASAAFSWQDFHSLKGAEVPITIGAQTLLAEGQGPRLTPELGGRVRDAAGRAEVVLRPGDFTAEAALEVLPPPAADAARRDAQLARQGLKALGDGREFSWSSSGSLKRAMVRLPFDRSLLPPELGLDRARVAYYNPDTGAWELQDNVAVAGDALRVEVTHFSVYQPVAVLPSAVPGLREAFAYPNPAVGTQEPILRTFLGQVDRLEVTIFDLAGDVVHSGSLEGQPTGISGGEYYYDYPWTGPKASGVYFAVIHGRASGQTVRARTRFAVVR